MSTKLFVGGLAWETTDEGLKGLFAQVGTVVSATVIMDKFSGRSKGFGFVEMSSEAEATEAVAKLNGVELDGRKIIVNEARPKVEGDRPRGGGYSGGGGGGQRDFRSNDRRGGGGYNRGGGDRRGGGGGGYR
jgi:RNA recognition motif-containing protein